MIEKLEEKRKKLNEIGEILKKKYRGIDKVIDEIVEKSEVWYTLDEVLYRPTIINLFGMTGCGKTGLVRDFAKLLGMYEKYCEVDVSRTGTNIDARGIGNNRFYGDNTSISGKIFNVIEDTSEKAILLIDEIDKITSQPSSSYNDVWNLLSDGRLGNGITILSRYESMIKEIEYYFEDFDTMTREMNYISNTNPKNTQSSIPEFGSDPLNRPVWNPYIMPIPFNKRYIIERVAKLVKVSSFDDFTPAFDLVEFGQLENNSIPFGAREYLRNAVIRGEQSLADIWKTPGLFYNQSLLNILRNSHKKIINKFNDATGRDPLVFSKLLIFNAGNVDGLYTDSSDTKITADELHDKTSKFSVEDLKVKLLEIFKSEQVARLGGNYIVYPSLDSKSFIEIITDNLKLIEDDTKKTTGIEVKLTTDKFINHIYKESVVASLGARPMISKLQGIVNGILPNLIKLAVIEDKKKISITALKNNFS